MDGLQLGTAEGAEGLSSTLQDALVRVFHPGRLGPWKCAIFGELGGRPEVPLEGGEVNLIWGQAIVVPHHQGVGGLQEVFPCELSWNWCA